MHASPHVSKLAFYHVGDILMDGPHTRSLPRTVPEQALLVPEHVAGCALTLVVRA